MYQMGRQIFFVTHSFDSFERRMRRNTQSLFMGLPQLIYKGIAAATFQYHGTKCSSIGIGNEFLRRGIGQLGL
ncbi:MAG: hypothetical protein COZ05_03045, partial [Armatimonadetes bacterium CG_4_10_14_3_um_filter_59_10]